jgi:2'-5' RNA ligase
MAIRCFFCVELPEDIKEIIVARINRLKERQPDLKWVRKEALHITLKFCGDLEEKKAARIGRKFGEYLSVHPAERFKIKTAGTGAFPGSLKARVLWLGIGEGSSSLKKIHGGIEQVLSDEGLKADRKPFHPHITLARVRNNSRIGSSFLDYFLEDPAFQCEWEAEKITFMESRLTPAGPYYHPIDLFELK